jgi:hypothetical protein
MTCESVVYLRSQSSSLLQTEKEMGGQHSRVDGTKAEGHHTSVRGQREMERAGCEVISGAPTVI